jgi:Kdo2-lipid IVA lauroyltransferase/acyltransferase
MSIKLRRATKRLRHDLLYLSVKTAFWLARSMPRSLGLALFGAAMEMAFRFPGKERKRTIEHLRLIYKGEWTEKIILKTAREVWVGMGKNLFDAVRLPMLPLEKLDRIVRSDDSSELFTQIGRNRGVIIIVAHTGCFEMLVHYFAKKGMRAVIVGRKLFDERIDRIVHVMRSGENVRYLDRDNSGRAIIRSLHEGWVLGALIDQDTNVEGVFARFLGKLAYTPSGPVRMAMKMHLPLFVITTARVERERHSIFINGPLSLEDTGDFDRDLVCNVQKANDCICQTIQAHPSQWVWMHRRWERKPSDKGLESVPSIDRI